MLSGVVHIICQPNHCLAALVNLLTVFAAAQLFDSAAAGQLAPPSMAKRCSLSSLFYNNRHIIASISFPSLNMKTQSTHNATLGANSGPTTTFAGDRTALRASLSSPNMMSIASGNGLSTTTGA